MDWGATDFLSSFLSLDTRRSTDNYRPYTGVDAKLVQGKLQFGYVGLIWGFYQLGGLRRTRTPSGLSVISVPKYDCHFRAEMSGVSYCTRRTHGDNAHPACICNGESTSSLHENTLLNVYEEIEDMVSTGDGIELEPYV
ncbi:uncharacterized protein LOC127245704 isoform X1 [Andrographis paniculata]|uniref:uncharacterized protein LOC127245704 isoform X1 n=1 Tax=Andrographis paniculata TaxID=175694 RepID=UPI0021E77BFE|nr:uncharacterized protein LOC127245704 isoform X1 [Andrographis paniculata]